MIVHSTIYNIAFIVHILAITAAFGTAMARTPLLRLAKGGSTEAATLGIKLTQRYSLPALIVASIAGGTLIATSDELFTFAKPWVSMAMCIVVVLLLLSWFVILPAQKAVLAALEGGNDATTAAKQAAMTIGMYDLGYVVLVVLMVWKPGQ